MHDFLILIFIILAFLGIAAIVILGGLFLVYGFFCLLDRWAAPDMSRKLRNMPEGTTYTAHTKAAGEAFRNIAPVFAYWEDTEAEELSVRVGSELADKMEASRKVLRNNGIRRQLRFHDLRLAQQNNGSAYRKWNDGGREWQACELSAAMLEIFTDADGRDLTEPCYFPTANIIYTMSRRLREEEKAASSMKDKWGRKISAQTDFYQGMRLTNCPSCGAPLSQGQKDIVCPSCGSTIFADYFDWQVESIEIEPETTTKSFAAILRNQKSGQRVIGLSKKSRSKIVRFSENGFRQDVLEAYRAECDENQLIDLFLGTLEIRSVRNTETETILAIRVPVCKTVMDGQGRILSSRDVRKGEFVRMRYPNRFNKKAAVISEEKKCPNCGGPFSPDGKGNCTYCGTFLFKDNLKWKPLVRG